MVKVFGLPLSIVIVNVVPSAFVAPLAVMFNFLVSGSNVQSV